MAEIFVFGSAAWDHVYQIEQLPAAGTPTMARDLGTRPGGSTANIARGLAGAGHRVRLVTRAGRDALGDTLMRELGSHGVDTAHMQRCRDCTPETLIFRDRDGERTIFVLEKECSDELPGPVPLPDLAEADAVFVGWFADYEMRLASILRHSRALVVTAVPPPDTAVDWCADIVTGSASEFPREWLDAPYEHVRTRVGDRLRWVVVTRGERGAAAYSEDAVVAIAAVRTEVVVDTTGAGDSFTSGLIHGLVQGEDIRTAGALGAFWASAALTRAQSVPPGWDELDLGSAGSGWSARLLDKEASW